MQAGLIEGQSFVAGGKQSKALLDLLAERLQPSALLYMMSCHAGVCPRRTGSQTHEVFHIQGRVVLPSEDSCRRRSLQHDLRFERLDQRRLSTGF